MSDDIEQIVDIHGETRRLGSLCPPAGFVSAFKTFEEEHPLWDDSDIKRVISDSYRTPRRQVFGDAWICEQGEWGACNGWASSGTLSRARWLRGIKDGLILSGSFTYSRINGGRDNGSALEDGMLSLQRDGSPPASLVKASMIYPKLQPKNAKEEAAKHKGLAAWAVQTKQGLRTAVAAGFPCVVAVHAGGRFQKLDSHGIVSGVDNGRGNHAVGVDDLVMINGKECFDMFNSWGLRYGRNGRAYLTWESFEQTFGVHTFFALGSTEERE